MCKSPRNDSAEPQFATLAWPCPGHCKHLYSEPAGQDQPSSPGAFEPCAYTAAYFLEPFIAGGGGGGIHLILSPDTDKLIHPRVGQLAGHFMELPTSEWNKVQDGWLLHFRSLSTQDFKHHILIPVSSEKCSPRLVSSKDFLVMIFTLPRGFSVSQPSQTCSIA